MAKKKSDRVTLRLSAWDTKVVAKLQKSGGFEDVSTTVRWCISFTNTLLKKIPETIGESFLVMDEDGEVVLTEVESVETEAEEIKKKS